MDLNVSPPEDEYYFEHVEKDNAPQRAQHKESAVEIERREREERCQRQKRKHIDEKICDNAYQKISRSFDKSKLPPGWLDCPPMGKEICGGIIPSKVPLSEYFNHSIPPGRRYSFKQLFDKLRVSKKWLGLVINLTNTNRYYRGSDLERDGIKYSKIPCSGRDSVPDNESVNKFVYEVSQFLSHPNQTKYILVHCTHGHNRTGFMIVHFLVRMRSFSVTQAIKEFADARPPGIYKPDYIEALYTFYHEDKPEMVVCPQTPEWKRSDFCPDGDKNDDDGDPTAPMQEKREISKVMTNDDELGDKIPDEQRNEMRYFCNQALKMKKEPQGSSKFPGSHPVSLSSDNIQILRQRYYYASWKADGTRYMMLITRDGSYLIDRNFNFRRVQVRFPCRISNEALIGKTHDYTLLDGEMVIDTVPDSENKTRRYLIYDMMALNGESIIERHFSERWELVQKEIIEPRNQERQASKNYRYDLEPFGVRRKGFWPLSTVNKILTKVIPELSHEADGLIFQGWDDTYVPQTHNGLLKWKYAHMNSVDFLFEMVDGQWRLCCFERGRKKLMKDKVMFNDEIDPALCSGKIIECSWDSEKSMWVYMRTRTDKLTPNDITTYTKVVKSIRDNITEEKLMIEINEIVSKLPMYVERIKNDQKRQRRK